MAKLDDIRNLDLYKILEIESTANEQDIKKAYRKKALKCHPDKNPDNPRAAELFLELSKALEILIDTQARTAYDKVYNAKKAAKIRSQELDSRRKKFKDELEARERQAAFEASSFGCKVAEEHLAAEIERLRKEGSRQLREEIENIKRQIWEARKLVSGTADPSLYRLRMKWKSRKDDESNGGYNTDNLMKMFSKYGDVDTVIVSQKKKGSGLVEFVKAEAAIKAVQLERGLANNPLTLTWLTGEPPNVCGRPLFDTPVELSTDKKWFDMASNKANLFPSASHSFKSTMNRPSPYLPKAKVNDDESAEESFNNFEATVLRRMRDAEEKKRKAAAAKDAPEEPPVI